MSVLDVLKSKQKALSKSMALGDPHEVTTVSNTAALGTPKQVKVLNNCDNSTSFGMYLVSSRILGAQEPATKIKFTTGDENLRVRGQLR